MTINEIAEKAGVSIGTVDRVIHNRGRVSPETISKVKKIIEDSGFTPNPLARQLALNKPVRIGVLLPKLKSDSAYWNLIYSGIQKAIDELKLLAMEVCLIEFARDKKGDFLLKYNSENPVVYVIKTTSLRIQGKYDEAIELAQKYIDRNDTYAYEFLRQQALCYLMKGEYKNAYDAANSSYGLYGNTLQSVDTLALCSIASNNMSTYDELTKLLEENEVQFSDEVTAYKNGTLTLEDILTKGDFDVQ